MGLLTQAEAAGALGVTEDDDDDVLWCISTLLKTCKLCFTFCLFFFFLAGFTCTTRFVHFFLLVHIGLCTSRELIPREGSAPRQHSERSRMKAHQDRCREACSSLS